MSGAKSIGIVSSRKFRCYGCETLGFADRYIDKIVSVDASQMYRLITPANMGTIMK